MSLGTKQVQVLRTLIEHGHFYPRCGWVWDTPRGTIRVLDALVRRGVVEKKTISLTFNRLGPSPFGGQVEAYIPTDAAVPYVEKALYDRIDRERGD